MPYYGDGLPYYYGGAFSNHSSLMTGTPRSFHTPLSRFSPHLSTISESPLTTLRRYSPVGVPSRPRRVIDTADIDVSTPRVLSGDGGHHRNRLRRDRPTIKIRSQALKDNPALREHNERHEKTVGELLVEKFLIKDKKLDEAEGRLQLFHQVSLDTEEDGSEEQAGLQQQAGKITRRFTRRRSSADIQLDPEQLEKEIAYAQVQAKVLDTLVAEEQAEIENEVRRGTLIKKGTVAGHKPGPGFFRALDRDAASASASASQGEEDSTVQKMRKSLKKVKKKKRAAEKPPDDENERERGSSTSSEASVDLQGSENAEKKLSRPQAFKIEASNSVGDFSTVWVKADPEASVSHEQFRESVKIPVPRRKLGLRKTDPDSVEEVEESEVEVVLLPVKKSYVKDTSRNSVHCTVKTPPEISKSDPMKNLKTVANGIGASESKGKPDKVDTSNQGPVFKDIPEEAAPRNDREAVANGVTLEKKEKPENVEEKLPVSKIVGVETSPKEALKESKTLKIDSPKEQKTFSNGVTWRKTEKPEKLEEKLPSPAFKSVAEEERGPESPKETFGNDVLWRKKEKSKNLEEKLSSPVSKNVAEEERSPAVPLEENKASKPDSPKKMFADGVPWRKKEKLEEKLPVSKSDAEEEKSVGEALKQSKTSKVDSPKKTFANGVTWRKKEETEKPKVAAESVPLPKKEEAKPKPTNTDADDSVPGFPRKEDKEDKVDKEDKQDKEKKEATEVEQREEKRPEPPRPRKQLSAARDQSGPKTRVASSVTLAVDPLASENSASVALPSTAVGLPKPSKITTDENNAVEAPKPALRGAEQRLAKATKTKRDENVVDGDPLPGNKAGKPVTLSDAHPCTGHPGEPKVPEDPRKPENRSATRATDDAILPIDTVTKTTLVEATDEKTEEKKTEEKKTSAARQLEDAASNKVNDDKEAKPPFKVAKRPEPKASKDVAPKVEPAAWRKKAKSNEVTGDSKKVSEESPSNKMPVDKVKVYECLNGETGGALSKSTSTESIDFWSEIKGPDSPGIGKLAKGLNFLGSEQVEDLAEEEEQLDKKKESDTKISVAGVGTPPLGNVPVIDQEPDEVVPSSCPGPKEAKKRKNLSIQIDRSEDAYSTVKRTPLKREDSTASTISARSIASTPDTAIPGSQVSTPVYEVTVPMINIVEVVTPTNADQQLNLEEDDGARTPTNEWSGSGPPKISKWDNHRDLSNVDRADQDVTPVASKVGSVAATPDDTPQGTPESSKKKKLVRKKKASTTKKSSAKDSKKESSKKEAKKEAKESKKSFAKAQESLKPTAESKSSSKPNTKLANPSPKPLDLIRMFYTTPSALLTATPRDLSKVRRAKIKRRKHHSRTPSVSSDSTGSTTSTATTGSTDGSRSTCTELDDDPDKRMNSTRSNDSGFDGSPRISNCDMACHKKCEKLTGNLCGLNQKLVAEALQAVKRAPSQSSDTQRNSDSSDHFPSGRITPPATNLPRFKKYAVTDFNFRKVLGKGSFGKVLLAELKGTECVYAVKCLKKDVVLEDDDVECTLIERKVLTLATRHPYLCHLFCTFQTESHLFFVMEYLNGGDLMFHIQKSGRFSEVRARFYAAEIWSGLNFLHKKGIVYRDLKLDNVLLDFEGHIRIADFGMCKLQIFLDRTADTFCGTPDYMAPEIIKGLKYNQAVDWWSYGVLLYEMLTGQSPFSGCDEDELFWSICNERPFIPRYLSQDSTDMLLCLLEKDAGKRLPGHDIAYHAFFQSLPWDRLERRQLEPPFKPALEHTLDTKYFDTAFTAERPRLTPVPEQILTSMDQGVFRGFSYTNPNATD